MKQPTDKQLLDFAALYVIQISTIHDAPKLKSIEVTTQDCGSQISQVGTAQTMQRAFRIALSKLMKKMK